MRKYTKYPKEHIDIIKPFLVSNIKNGVPVKEIALKLGMNYETLTRMMYRNNIWVRNERRDKKIGD